MIAIDSYSIEQYPNKNRIVITLPQTLVTLTDTASPIAERRISLDERELATLLGIVKRMYEVEE